MENKLKHLEFIQNTIQRMSSHSFYIKGWCITVIGGMIALLDKNDLTSYVPGLLLIILLFWLIDSYYLYQEKRYRKLYDQVSIRNNDDIDFSMQTTKDSGMAASAFFSFTLIAFYVSASFISLIIAFSV